MEAQGQDSKLIDDLWKNILKAIQIGGPNVRHIFGGDVLAEFEKGVKTQVSDGLIYFKTFNYVLSTEWPLNNSEKRYYCLRDRVKGEGLGFFLPC